MFAPVPLRQLAIASMIIISAQPYSPQRHEKIEIAETFCVDPLISCDEADDEADSGADTSGPASDLV